MATVSHQAYTFDPRPDYPLLITAKRYWRPGPSELSVDPAAFTIIFAHGNGFHKEQWEPTIEELYVLLDKAGIDKIRDVWSIDIPNHGDAAILNEQTLVVHQPVFAWEEYARSIHAFIAGLGTGVDVDFSSRNIVAIGHSMGASAFILSNVYRPPIKYTSIILVEPMILSIEMILKRPNPFVDLTSKRRDIWPSRTEAYNTLKTRPVFRDWDDRVLKIFVEHGLRPLPTLDYPDQTDGVTLKCSRKQEMACFNDAVGPTRTYRYLSTVLKRLPVHIMYGSIDDAVAGVKMDVLHKASGGIHNFASVTWIQGEGHLIVQTNPNLLAQKLCDVLLPSMTAASPKAML